MNISATCLILTSIALSPSLFACNSEGSPLAEPNEPSTSANQQLLPSDIQFIQSTAAFRLGRIIPRMVVGLPEFGGFYINASGDLIAIVNDLSAAGEARIALRNYIGSWNPDRRQQYGDIIVQLGTYSFLELSKWRDQLNSIFRYDKVIFTDVNERLNRVTIGISDNEIKEELLNIASEQGVPAEAILFEETEPFITKSTLQDRIRPVVGGLEITSNKFCSLGFIAERVGDDVFVTASHCTFVQGGVEDTPFAQPDATHETIGIEITDPEYIGLPQCPSGDFCRYSDARTSSMLKSKVATVEVRYLDNSAAMYTSTASQ